MAIVQKVMARKAAATSSETLYTVPSARSAVVTNIVVANASATTQDVTIALNGITLIDAGPVNGNDTLVLDIRQVMETAQTITGFATSTDIKIHISGVEIF
jgi:hypothetical protein